MILDGPKVTRLTLDGTEQCYETDRMSKGNKVVTICEAGLWKNEGSNNL